MKKAAATISILIGSLLLVVVCVSFATAVNTAQQKESYASIKAQTDAIAAGNEVAEPPDDSLSSSTLTILGLTGAAFLIAGLALWPKAPEVAG